MTTARGSVLGLCLRLTRYARRRRGALLGLGVAMVVEIAVNLLKPWPLKLLVDNVLGDEPLPAWLADVVSLLPGGDTDENVLGLVVALTVLLFVVGWGAGLARAYASIWFGQRMVYDLAADVLSHVQRLSLRYHVRRGAGDLVRRVTADTSCVSTIVQSALIPAVVATVTLVAMFVLMWQLDPLLSGLAVVIVPLLVMAFKRYSGPMLERGYAEQQAYGRLYEVVEQRLSGIGTVQAFQGESEGDDRFRKGARDILDESLGVTGAQLRFGFWVGGATALGTALIMLVGAHAVLQGRISTGTVLVFLAYLTMLYAPLSELMLSSSNVQTAAGSALRVLEVLDEVPDVVDRPGAAPLPAVRGRVSLEGVSFGYEPGRPVLRDVWLEAPPGAMVAVVGPTGAGKSTLAGLVLRLFDPDAGRVLLDGVDVRDVQLASVRAQVSLVLQESFLFPVSVADNIRYGRPDASMAEVVAAAEAANAVEFIERLPEGFDTVLGERGATLSGGQRQRVAIARALVKDAPVLVLDEPTSAVDARTEGLLLEALDRLMVGRTTLVIAHRLSTVRRADVIVVLDEGRVVETGTHEELVAAGGLYSRLHAADSASGEVIDLTPHFPGGVGR